jgi:hypothetical protein
VAADLRTRLLFGAGAPAYAPVVALERDYVRALVARLRSPGASKSRMSKRAVEQPTAEERRFSQGAAIYGCAEGHAWLVYLRRQGDQFLPVDPGHLYCIEDPCVDRDDEAARGEKISGIRWWVGR